MKKAAVIGLLILGGALVLNKTSVGRQVKSYVCTFFSRNAPQVNQLVSRDFEIDRMRNEIEKLDADVRGLLGPIAEKQVAINRLERDLKVARENVKERRTALLSLTQKVEAATETVSFEGEDYTLDDAKARLARDFVLCKDLDAHLKSQEKLLNAQRQALRAAHEQLARITEQKRSFEVRLAQLEATEESLKAQRVNTPLNLDQTRVSDINSTLEAIQRAQEVETTRRALEHRYGTQPGQRSQSTVTPAPNLNEIRTFLGVPTSSNKVAASSN